MTRLILSVNAILLILAGYANGAQTTMPDGYGVVVDVYQPSQPGYKRFNTGNSYVVISRYGWYSPPGNTGPIAQDDYNVLKITNPSGMPAHTQYSRR